MDSRSGADATLVSLYQDPGAGYTAYVVSGRDAENHGDDTTNTDENLTGKVRDGGRIVNINEDATLGGRYGATGPSDVEVGGLLASGDYNIRLGDNEDPIVIHYESEHTISPAGRVPVAFNCNLFREEWGEGQVQGTMAGGLRNVLTFPPTLDGCSHDGRSVLSFFRRRGERYSSVLSRYCS